MFYKIVENGYIILIGESEHCKNPITKKEYEKIKEIFMNKPIAPSGFDYRLTTNYEWKLYELPVFEEEAEALQKQWEEEMNEEIE